MNIVVVPEFVKIAKSLLLYTFSYIGKINIIIMVQQSDVTVLKRFLADTNSNQILHFNCVSESEEIEDFKNHGFQKNRALILPKISL